VIVIVTMATTLRAMDLPCQIVVFAYFMMGGIRSRLAVSYSSRRLAQVLSSVFQRYGDFLCDTDTRGMSDYV